MKIAALALVLIVASAVVLIFANTLNSWVLGGLIGGLAALLISIPISLIIFTALARRQDERLVYARMMEQEEDLAYDEYAEDEDVEVYEADAYVLPAYDEAYDEYEDYREYEEPRGRRIPEARGLPAPGQSHSLNNQRGLREPSAYRPPTRDLPTAQQQRNRGTGHQRQPRTPQTTRSLRSQQHAAALRAARREAEQELRGTGELSSGLPRRTTTRQLPQQALQLRRQQRSDDTRTRRPTSLNSADETNGSRQFGRTDGLRLRETETDRLRGQNPTTGSIRWHPDTGKTARNPQLDEDYTDSENWTGSLKNPLVRRAPYLYEDDPLREEFAQQIDKPIVRRSSRYLHPQEEE